MKSPKISKVVLTIFLVVTIPYFGKQTCEDWNKGFDGQVISNENPKTCQVHTPNGCIFELTHRIHRFFSFMDSDCKNRRDEEALLIKENYPENGFFGYVRTEFGNETERLHTKLFDFAQHKIPLTGLDDPRGENLTIFRNQTSYDKAELIIRIKRNETLVKLKEELIKKNSNEKSKNPDLPKNVLMIFFDSLSRAQMNRKLKKTMAWIEKFINKKHPEMEGYQFLKFHSYQDMTMSNLGAVFYNVEYNLWRFINAPKAQRKYPDVLPKCILDMFNDQGFITGYTANFCSSGFSNALVFTKLLGSWKSDYEGYVWACDPVYSPYAPGHISGLNQIREKCLYGKDSHEYNIEFADQFWRTYPDERKFMTLKFMDAHAVSQQVASYIDNHLPSLLTKLESDGLLKDTSIIFYTDHGLHFPTAIENNMHYSSTVMEKYLPFLVLIVPKKTGLLYGNDIKQNEQRLTVPHDIYYTLRFFGDGEFHNKSLLTALPEDRGCEFLEKLQFGFCVCDYNPA